MHGEPALPAGFRHLPHVNPDAPKRGSITYGVQGTFDSLNPFIIKGVAARGLWDYQFGNNVYESLLVRNRDEPFSLYGLLAESIETPPERNWVEFRLRKEVKFSDGTPVTAEDVIFSLALLRNSGRPHYHTWFKKIVRMESRDARIVRLIFEDGKDRELPLLIGLAPILPEHAIDPTDFEKSSLDIPIGSGPYTVDKVDLGSTIVLKRNPHYWGAHVPVKVGHDNFDQIRIEYFRDRNSLFEAFKKGLIDLIVESDPKRWAQGYDFPAVKDGDVIKQEFHNDLPAGMTGFVFNTRRPIFSDIRVRHALVQLFDFELVNKNLYFGLYERTEGYFDGSDLSSIRRPASDAEKTLLAPFPNAVTPAVMKGDWHPPRTDGTGTDRAPLARAVAMLREAGWEIKNGKMINKATGEPFAFETLTRSSDEERLALAYARTLKRVGIEVTVRTVDSAQYERRRIAFDYDMTVATWTASLSPGNEQTLRWSQASADEEGSFNFAGAREPALDAMITAMLKARSREDFVTAVRAFDRVLISGAYAVPLFHLPADWIVRWRRIVPTETTPLTGYRLDTWWYDDSVQ
ncbi:extracellular solute-binding protein [Breoghania sp.]|uniref:extracellular solute-binding protein n=1 Tax=Breoghania sp. TaxID=2065378 RepID=UPI0026399150|nr:extracellular solute-binding protein [Breoghania sp.]MDJ0929835.1 extracellular solute-binding protein [Breoghania sp.]